MTIWVILGLVFLAGATGGLLNAMITDNGFFCPRVEQVKSIRVVRPGFIGNVLVGAVTAVISWGLNSPFAEANLLENHKLSLTPSTLAGAILIGVAGAKWLTSEVDKRLLKAAVNQAAKAHSSPEAAEQMLMASPAETLNITKKLQL